MEPKDLKNSEELKSTEKKEQEPVSENEKTVEETVEQTEELSAEVEEKTAEKETPTEETTAEEVTATTEKVTEPVAEATVEKETEPTEETTTEEVSIANELAPEKEVNQIVEATEEAQKEEVAEPEKEVAAETVEERKEEVEEKPAAEKVDAKEDTLKQEVKKEEKVVKEVPPVEEKKEPVDYTKHSQVELVNALRDVLEQNDDHNIKNEVETIKSVFYKNLNEKAAEAKVKFVEEGGKEEDFVAEEDPYERDIKNLLKEYRHLRIEFSKKFEIEKEENLKLKYQVIEDIKGLINNEESINKTFHDFKELQRKWREIGLVPQSKMKKPVGYLPFSC